MARDRDDRKRHRSHSEKSKHRKDRHRKSSSSRRESSEEQIHREGGKKLTQEEERLYENAKAYLQAEGEDDRDGRHDNKRSKRSRKEDYSNSSDDSRHKRRHKSDKHKSRKSEHKRSRKGDNRDKKKSKHRHDKDEKKRHKEAPSIDTSKLFPIGSITNNPPNEQLDPSLHYFSHNPHLRLYLYRRHGLYFEDLSSESSRKYFSEFVNAYNSGSLEEAYYNPRGLPDEALDQCSRTKHKWKFNTSGMEEEKLNLVKLGVRKQTEYDAGGTPGSELKKPSATAAAAVVPRKDDDEYDRGQSRLEKRAAQKLSDKRHKERIKLANEEIHSISKPTSGWERQQEKKRERSNMAHGAYKDREDVMGGADLDDDAIYGSGEIGGRKREVGFNEAVAKERERRERREVEMARRVEDGKRKEEEKRKEMLAMLGLSGVDVGKKITIEPRRDGV